MMSRAPRGINDPVPSTATNKTRHTPPSNSTTSSNKPNSSSASSSSSSSSSLQQRRTSISNSRESRGTTKTASTTAGSRRVINGNGKSRDQIAPAAEPRGSAGAQVPVTKISSRLNPRVVQTLGMGAHKT
ncbi:hypothetical protein HDU76_003706, partial [Blyttiomyces sp. JEL0837]